MQRAIRPASKRCTSVSVEPCADITANGSRSCSTAEGDVPGSSGVGRLDGTWFVRNYTPFVKKNTADTCVVVRGSALPAPVICCRGWSTVEEKHTSDLVWRDGGAAGTLRL
jgi:hypothetical protein